MDNPPHTATRKQVQVTTVADSAIRPFVEPYGNSPKVDVPRGVIACTFCANTRFRRSRMRLQDVPQLLLLRYPLRCIRCNHRQYGSFFTAGISLPGKTLRERLADGSETWQSWTERSHRHAKSSPTHPQEDASYSEKS